MGGCRSQVGCNKGLWEVQPALRERRAPLSPCFGGEERSWGKSRGRERRGEAFEVGTDKVGAGREKGGKTMSPGTDRINHGVWPSPVPLGRATSIYCMKTSLSGCARVWLQLQTLK